MYVCICICVSICAHVYRGAHKDLRRTSDPLDVKLQVSVSHQHGCWDLNSCPHD